MTDTHPPQFIVIAGPNGAGKTTWASTLLPDTVTFVNADEIARTLPGFPSAAADVQAGRILLQRMDELASRRADFALETTLASRSLAPRIMRLRSSGYRFHLFFLWLSSADLSVARVVERVRRGGHSIPEEVIRRRYNAGLQNFFTTYQPLADDWVMSVNTESSGPVRVADGSAEGLQRIYLPDIWSEMVRTAQL
jgi:predicted ABC-type ATPase